MPYLLWKFQSQKQNNKALNSNPHRDQGMPKIIPNLKILLHTPEHDINLEREHSNANWSSSPYHPALRDQLPWLEVAIAHRPPPSLPWEDADDDGQIPARSPQSPRPTKKKTNRIHLTFPRGRPVGRYLPNANKKSHFSHLRRTDRVFSFFFAFSLDDRDQSV